MNDWLKDDNRKWKDLEIIPESILAKQVGLLNYKPIRAQICEQPWKKWLEEL